MKNVRRFYGFLSKTYYHECRSCFEKAMKKDCEEYSKTFNRQNDEIISLRKEIIRLKSVRDECETQFQSKV